MKKTYEKPELNMSEFDVEDVIAASTVPNAGDGDEITVDFPFGI